MIHSGAAAYSAQDELLSKSASDQKLPPASELVLSLLLPLPQALGWDGTLRPVCLYCESQKHLLLPLPGRNGVDCMQRNPFPTDLFPTFMSCDCRHKCYPPRTSATYPITHSPAKNLQIILKDFLPEDLIFQ